jgi:hypothetical protein
LPSGGAASAFLLKSFLQVSIMVCLLPDLLSAGELGTARGGRHGGQIPLPHVDPNHLLHLRGRRVEGFDLDRHQQVEAFLAAVIPQPGSTDAGSFVQQRQMFVVSLIGHMDPARERQQTDLLATLQRVVSSIDVAQCRGHIVRGFIQTSKSASLCIP